MIIALFFIAHWYGSLFFQSFFLHRYASHKTFTMNKGWERFFYLFTYLAQGSSFLYPHAYASMHRDHHAFSDTDKDPHSPHFFKDVLRMSWGTILTFRNHVKRSDEAARNRSARYPMWTIVDRIGSSIPSRLLFGAGYLAFYLAFATHWWMFLLLPIHFLMGPIHGAIVNWCGHKYGYANFDNKDHSKNSSPVDLLMLGELFQNNHHRYPNAANFGVKWYEFDPVYPVIRALDALKIIRLRKAIIT